VIPALLSVCCHLGKRGSSQTWQQKSFFDLREASKLRSLTLFFRILKNRDLRKQLNEQLKLSLGAMAVSILINNIYLAKSKRGYGSERTIGSLLRFFERSRIGLQKCK
jgi:hypothetical protein